MQLWIVRHGRCDPGVDNPLNFRGMVEAQATAHRLGTYGISHIITSPLLRAVETAAIIARQLGNMPVAVWPDLREGNSESHRASPAEAILARYPHLQLPPDFATDGWDYGGDTYEQMLDRGRALLTRLLADFGPADRVLIVTHGGIANHLLHVILGIPAETPAWFEMDYCAISRVRLVPEADRQGWPLYPAVSAELLCLNDVAHLTDGAQESSRL